MVFFCRLQRLCGVRSVVVFAEPAETGQYLDPVCHLWESRSVVDLGILDVVAATGENYCSDKLFV